MKMPMSLASNSVITARVVLLTAFLGVLPIDSGRAQMAGTGDSLLGIENRVEQLEHKLTQLRRDVDTESMSSAKSSSSSGFSSNDSQMPQGFAARAEIRMGELEEELTRLTGMLEEINFSVSSTTTRLDKLVEDVDFRLSALERASSTPAASISPSASRSATAPVETPVRTMPPLTKTPPESVNVVREPVATPMPGAGQPRSLGTISPDDIETEPAAGAALPDEPAVEQAPLPAPSLVPDVLPTGTPKEQYDYAYKLVRQGDYTKAEHAFREFGTLNPSDPLAGNARYWLGETYYVRQDFVQAADVFIGVVTGYPDSPKRPHSMLKLGMSLLAMGQKPEGCATLNELLASYPEGAAATRTRAETERERAGCS